MAFAAGIALLVQPFLTSPVFATQAALLDDAALRQSAAPAMHDDRDPDGKASKSRLSEADQQDDRHTDISQIIRPPDSELKTAKPALPLGLTIRPTEVRLFDPGTNIVFSANLSTGLGTTAP